MDKLPIHELDDVTHQRVRLGVLALLSKVRKLEFTRIRDELGVTDGNLARHLETLARANYIETQKLQQDKKTWISLTKEGREALLREVAALKEVVSRIED